MAHSEVSEEANTKASNSTSKHLVFLLKWNGETRQCRVLGQFQKDSVEDWGFLGFWSQLGVSVCLCVFVDARLQQLIPTTNSVR